MHGGMYGKVLVRLPGLTRNRMRKFERFVAGRSWRETLKFAICANDCADQPPTSPPSRARTSIWRAAGSLRRQRCGPVRAADALPATQPLSAPAGRTPGPCPGTIEGTRCIATLHLYPPWTASQSHPAARPHPLNSVRSSAACWTNVAETPYFRRNDPRGPQMRAFVVLVTDLLETRSNIVLSGRFALSSVVSAQEQR